MKEAIDGVFGAVKVRVDLTAPQVSRTGKVLFHVMYMNSDLLSLAPGFNGCPHHGGEHSFCIEGPRTEVNAFLQLMAEQYPGIKPACDHAISMVRKEFINGEWRKYGRINFKLKTQQVLQRLPSQDQPYPVKWFDQDAEQL